MGVAAGVHDLRPCGMLRFLAGKARDKAFSSDPASGHALRHAWPPMDVVLRA